MAGTSDPVAHAGPGTFKPYADLITYKGTEPSLAGRLGEARAQPDGSASVPCVGVGVGTAVCVIGQGAEGGRATVKGEAGGALT